MERRSRRRVWLLPLQPCSLRRSKRKRRSLGKPVYRRSVRERLVRCFLPAEWEPGLDPTIRRECLISVLQKKYIFSSVSLKTWWMSWRKPGYSFRFILWQVTRIIRQRLHFWRSMITSAMQRSISPSLCRRWHRQPIMRARFILKKSGRCPHLRTGMVAGICPCINGALHRRRWRMAWNGWTFSQ